MKMGDIEVTPEQWLAASTYAMREHQKWQQAWDALVEALKPAVEGIHRVVTELNRLGLTAESIRKAQRRTAVADRRVAQQLAVRNRRRARNARRRR